MRVHRRVIEDILPIEPRVTEHIVNGYWCSKCKKIVTAKVTEALPNASIGLRLVVFTACLHYLVGVSVDNLVSLLSMLSNGVTHWLWCITTKSICLPIRLGEMIAGQYED